MSNRNLSLLVVLAAASIVLAVIMAQLADKPYAKKSQIAYLIQGLDPDQIAKITIGKPGEEVIFNRRGANFVIANLNNYPAVTSEINKLITTCLDIQTNELYTENSQNHKDLGVTEDDARILVKFYKADSTLLTVIVIGRQKQQGQGLGFIRRVDDNKVYLASAQIPAIKKQSIEYISQQLTNVQRDDINSVTVSCPNETYVLRPGPDEKTVYYEILPEGKKINIDVANKVLSALSGLTIEDVNSESAKANLIFDKRYLCRLKDTTIYSIWLAQDGEDWFLKCDADFSDKTPITKTQGEVETEEQLKIKEAKLLARDAAEEFSQNHKNWVYKIPSYRAENLTKTSTDIFEQPRPMIEEVNEISEPVTQEE